MAQFDFALPANVAHQLFDGLFRGDYVCLKGGFLRTKQEASLHANPIAHAASVEGMSQILLVPRYDKAEALQVKPLTNKYQGDGFWVQTAEGGPFLTVAYRWNRETELIHGSVMLKPRFVMSDYAVAPPSERLKTDFKMLGRDVRRLMKAH